jgi:hypothetical protein
MRFIPLLAVVVAVAGCAPRVPDSAAGVRGDDDAPSRAAPGAQGTDPVPPAGAISDEATGTGEDTGAALAAETQAALDAIRAAPGETPLEADPNNPPPETVTTPGGISEENDFEAVDEARSIESDKALIARNRERYKVIEPTRLPARPDDSGPNIVAYALATNHPVGTRLYKRFGFNKEAKYRRNCAEYASADQAQRDFLDRGGPERDRRGLDPDGDGFACAWDPTPFRKAVGR